MVRVCVCVCPCLPACLPLCLCSLLVVWLFPGDIKTTGGGDIISSGTLSVAETTTLTGDVTIESTTVATSHAAAASLWAKGGLAVGEKGFFGDKVTVDSGGLDLNAGGIASAGAIAGLTSLAGTGAVTATAGAAVTITSGSGTNVALTPGGAGKVTVGGTAPTVEASSDAEFTIAAGGSANNVALAPTGAGHVTIGGNAPTIAGSTDADLTIAAGGTNRNIALNPTGTGYLTLGGGLVYGLEVQGAASGGNVIGTGTSAIHLTSGTATGSFNVNGPSNAVQGRAVWIRNDSGDATTGDFVVANSQGCLYVYGTAATWIKFMCGS